MPMMLDDTWKIEVGYINDDFIHQRLSIVCSKWIDGKNMVNTIDTICIMD